MNLQILLVSQFDSLLVWNLTDFAAVDLESFNGDWALEAIGVAKFDLHWKLIPSATWAAMQPLNKKLIEISNLSELSDPTKFTGTVEVVEFEDLNGASTKAVVTCMDDRALMDTTVVNLKYTNDNDYHVLTNMLGVYFPSYFNIDAALQTTDLDYFNSQYETAAEFVRRLRGRSGTSFYTAPGKKIHYYYTEDLPAGFRYDESGTTPSNTASVRPYKVEKYLHDTSGMVTRVYVIGNQDPDRVRHQNYTELITVGGDGTNPVVVTLANRAVALVHPFRGLVTKPGGGYRLSSKLFQYNDPSLLQGKKLASAATATSQMVTVNQGESILTTITTPGPKLIVYRDFYGITAAVNWIFNAGRSYRVEILATIFGNSVSVIDTGSASSTQTAITVSCPGASVYGDSVFIGDGWPILVDQSKGTVTYMPASAGAIAYPGDTGIQDGINYDYFEVCNAVATYEPSRNTYGGYIAGGDREGGYRYFDMVVRDDNVKDLASARARARAELLARANGTKTGTFSTLYGEGLVPGMNLRLTSTQFGFDETFIINKMKVETFGPGKYDGNVQAVTVYTYDFGDYNPELADLLSKLGKQKDDSQFDDDIIFGDVTNYTTLDRTYFGVSTSVFGNVKFTG